MTIHLYSIIRNESRILPYFLRHYVPWVDRLIFYDAGSTDGTREIIQSCPKTELRDWNGADALVDDEFLALSNSAWKEARGVANWVIWVDADELLYYPNIRELLKFYRDAEVTVPRIEGYTMVSHTFPQTPTQIYDEVRTGFRDDCWAKLAIFNPVIDMCWHVGRHGPNITTGKQPVFSANADIKLLHYRALGLDYLRERHARNWARVPEHCRSRSYGANTSPGHEGHHGLAWFEEMMKREWDNVI